MIRIQQLKVPLNYPGFGYQRITGSQTVSGCQEKARFILCTDGRLLSGKRAAGFEKKAAYNH